MLSKRLWNVIGAAAILSFALAVFFSHDRLSGLKDSLIAPPKKVRPLGPIFKPKTKTKEVPPIKDNFPLLGNTENGTLPAVPSWNKPPVPHASEQTPLFIGFTRNWPILQQCVLSYIAAGWPPEDIYVVDNTGTMKSNFPPKPKLTLQNPFYLNVQRLTDVFGVNVISTPTLLTFAQLQNFYIFTAIEHHWDYYFWGHMDIIVLAEERYKGVPYKSFYQRALDKVKEVSSPQYLRNSVSGQQDEWGIQFFAYDWLALNNVKSFLKIGAWDTFISYYTADCDTHARFTMNGIKMPLADAGRVSDVGGPIDLNLLFRRKIDPQHPPQTVHELDKLPEDECGGPGFDLVIAAVKEQVDVKKNAKLRNAWQNAQVGGQGEPFYRDPEGFQQALEMIISNGVNTYQAKWGHRECNLVESGLHPNHAWKVEKDWDEKE